MNGQIQPHSLIFPDTLSSARRIAPIVIAALGVPERVVDLGGGTGGWCRAFRENGSSKVTCIDHADTLRSQLHIEPEEFLACDLSAEVPQPIACDLVLSLEVAEHLPRESSQGIVRFLTSCAPRVLFSAAIPGQQGHKHVNERPARYWRELFGEHGFDACDIIRPRIINDVSVPYWYRQNMLLFARRDSLQAVPVAMQPFGCIPEEFELVHERVLNAYRSPGLEPKLSELLRQMPRALRASLRRQLRG